MLQKLNFFIFFLLSLLLSITIKMRSEAPYLLQMPFDIISDISEYLDLCSRTCLMDTCRQMRYLFLSSKHLWKRIVFDIRLYDIFKIYSSLRKLGDSNGLRQYIQEVCYSI